MEESDISKIRDTEYSYSAMKVRSNDTDLYPVGNVRDRERESELLVITSLGKIPLGIRCKNNDTSFRSSRRDLLSNLFNTDVTTMIYITQVQSNKDKLVKRNLYRLLY